MDLAPPPTWRLHIPSGILTTGPIITVVLIIAMAWNEPDQYASTITEATSWRILFDSAGTGVIIAAALSAWIAPRLASVTQAIGLQPWVAQPVDHPLYTFFIWLRPVLVALDVLLTLRQRSLATWTEGPSGLPEHVEVLDTPALRRVSPRCSWSPPSSDWGCGCTSGPRSPRSVPVPSRARPS